MKPAEANGHAIRWADLPRPTESRTLVMADGARIVLRRHGNPDGPRLALSHGNGLAIDGYFPFWRLLLDRFDLVLFDMRNHGINPLHGSRGHDWAHFAADMEAVRRGIDDAFGAEPVAGVFHSLSAIAAALHLREAGRRWDALVLFDPPFCPREGHPLQEGQRAHMAEMSSRARRRPTGYADPRYLAFQMAMRKAHRGWVKGAHELMARATLRENPGGGEKEAWTLACPRELEANVFETNVDPTVWPSLAETTVPVKIVGADPEGEFAGQPARVCRAMGDELPIDYSCVEGTSHFLQVENPARCVELMEEFLRKHGLAA